MKPTLVVIAGGLRINEGLHLPHGSELPPGVLVSDEVAQYLDQGRLEESGRRSYYRLFPEFSESGLELPLPLEAELGVFTLPGVT
jgi:hypothetical protein